MAAIVVKQNDNISKYVVEGFLESRADVATLSTDQTPGSTFCVIADGSVWVLNTNKEWQELTLGGAES